MGTVRSRETIMHNKGVLYDDLTVGTHDNFGDLELDGQAGKVLASAYQRLEDCWYGLHDASSAPSQSSKPQAPRPAVLAALQALTTTADNCSTAQQPAAQQVVDAEHTAGSPGACRAHAPPAANGTQHGLTQLPAAAEAPHIHGLSSPPPIAAAPHLHVPLPCKPGDLQQTAARVLARTLLQQSQAHDTGEGELGDAVLPQQPQAHVSGDEKPGSAELLQGWGTQSQALRMAPDRQMQRPTAVQCAEWSHLGPQLCVRGLQLVPQQCDGVTYLPAPQSTQIGSCRQMTEPAQVQPTQSDTPRSIDGPVQQQSDFHATSVSSMEQPSAQLIITGHALAIHQQDANTAADSVEELFAVQGCHEEVFAIQWDSWEQRLLHWGEPDGTLTSSMWGCDSCSLMPCMQQQPAQVQALGAATGCQAAGSTAETQALAQTMGEQASHAGARDQASGLAVGCHAPGSRQGAQPSGTASGAAAGADVSPGTTPAPAVAVAATPISAERDCLSHQEAQAAGTINPKDSKHQAARSNKKEKRGAGVLVTVPDGVTASDVTTWPGMAHADARDVRALQVGLPPVQPELAMCDEVVDCVMAQWWSEAAEQLAGLVNQRLAAHAAQAGQAATTPDSPYDPGGSKQGQGEGSHHSDHTDKESGRSAKAHDSDNGSGNGAWGGDEGGGLDSPVDGVAGEAAESPLSSYDAGSQAEDDLVSAAADEQHPHMAAQQDIQHQTHNAGAGARQALDRDKPRAARCVHHNPLGQGVLTATGYQEGVSPARVHPQHAVAHRDPQPAFNQGVRHSLHAESSLPVLHACKVRDSSMTQWRHQQGHMARGPARQYQGSHAASMPARLACAQAASQSAYPTSSHHSSLQVESSCQARQSIRLPAEQSQSMLVSGINSLQAQSQFTSLPALQMKDVLHHVHSQPSMSTWQAPSLPPIKQAPPVVHNPGSPAVPGHQQHMTRNQPRTETLPAVGPFKARSNAHCSAGAGPARPWATVQASRATAAQLPSRATATQQHSRTPGAQQQSRLPGAQQHKGVTGASQHRGATQQLDTGITGLINAGTRLSESCLQGASHT